MKQKLLVQLAACAAIATSASAAVTVTPLGISATLQGGPVSFSVAPLSSSEAITNTATVGSLALNFQFYENESLYLGFGGAVPVGTIIQNPASVGPGTVGLFSSASASGQYYIPFTQELEDDGPFLKAFGYVTFNYDNATQTINLISTTVQDTPSGSLTVVAAVPEPSALALVGAGALGLSLRRSRKRA